MSVRIRHRAVGLLAGTALAVGSVGVAAAVPSHSGALAARGAKISLATTSRGRVLVGPNGHSLYMFTSDTRNKSHCHSACRVDWPPLMSKHAPRAGTGIKASKLGRTAAGQVTYYGHPLYDYHGDSGAGQTNGEDLFLHGGYWYLLNAHGHSVF